MADLKRLNLKKKQRQGLQINVTREVKKAGKFFSAGESDNVIEAQVCCERLIDYRANLKVLNEDILSCTDDADIDEEISKASANDDVVLGAIKTLSVKIQAADRENGAANSSFTKKTATVKLPKLQISKFSGDPLRWQEFWDSFHSTIHENDELTEIDKFKYLKNFLTGDALKVVEGYRLTSVNYEAVVDALKARYSNPETAIFAHFEALLELPVANYELEALQRNFDECQKHIRSLVALGLEEKTFGQVFTPIILSKLPKFVRIEVHRKNGQKPWELANLRDLLKDEIRAREMAQHTFAPGHSTESKPHVRKAGELDFKRKRGLHGGTTSALIAGSESSKRKCHFCAGPHWSDTCRKFPDHRLRKSKVKGNCFRCLQRGHTVDSCQYALTCCHCKSDRHHRSLCHQKFPAKEASQSSQILASGLNAEAIDFAPGNAVVASLGNTLLSHGERAYLQTALAAVSARASPNMTTARVFFDTGGSRTFVTSSLCRKIGAKVLRKEVVSIAGFMDRHRKDETYEVVELDIQLLDGSRRTVTANVTPLISCPIQKVPINFNAHPWLKQIQLAEPATSQLDMAQIDLLIGNDYYYDFVLPEVIHCSDGLRLVASRLGYLTAGKIRDGSSSNGTIHMMLLSAHGFEPSSTFDLEKFWRLEDIGIKDQYDVSDDEAALKSFHDNVRFENGRYEVCWPWKNDTPDLPGNFGLSLGRLRALIKRIGASPEVLAKYNSTIQEQERLGIVERVSIQQKDGHVHYIPHHCVLTPGKATTKLRIVYDASAKSSPSELSLNECLHRGPVILSDLCGLLLRFRLHNIAFVADIEKAFLQVSLRLTERDVTRFLWLKDLSKAPLESNLLVFRFCRVPFGIISSPFLLAATVSHHLMLAGTTAAKEMAGNMYVDNVLTGQPTLPQAKEFYATAKELLYSAGMNLREWFSNSLEFLKSIDSADRGQGSETKVLGLSWNTSEDVISCAVSDVGYSTVATKRKLLQALAKVYDPCGYFTPITISGKILMQELWKKKYSWDESLPEAIVDTWKAYFAQMQKIGSIFLPRCVTGGTLLSPDVHLELHSFCDASASAYAATVYLRIVSPSATITNLIFPKARVAPVKVLTVPRLELMAALLGTRILKFVETELRLKIACKYLWTDSTCVLDWLSSIKIQTKFVQNRLQEIKSNSDTVFRYVPTEINPADLPSRGCTVTALQSSDLWWHGPDFLQGDPSTWPQNKLSKRAAEVPEVPSELANSKSEVVLSVALNMSCDVSPIPLAKYSKLSRLMRVTSWVFRFLRNICLRKAERNLGGLTAKEISSAEQYWIKERQSANFNNSTPNWEKRQKLQLFQQLHVFADTDDILRCRGRLDNSELPEGAQDPILLPKDDHLTDLIIADYHTRLSHAGVRHTLSQIRYKFWVIHGRSQVKRVIKSCSVCRKITGGHFLVPKAPPLPNWRVTRSDPFACVGVDYFGPLFVKAGPDEKTKVWLCLFTCAVIRAVHLEVVINLSAKQFLFCLRRFMAIYGRPSLIISDNASQFKAAHKTLAVIVSECLSSAEVQAFSASEGISWKFITELSPWMGGFYERMVGTVKGALKKMLGRRCVTLIELQTIATEISSIVNSRPLTFVGEDVGDQPLTPGHFLLKRGRLGMPQVQLPSQAMGEYQPKQCTARSLAESWSKTETILSSFWKVWSGDYLLSLREQRGDAHHRSVSSLPPEIGAVVLVKDALPRANWRLGRVVKLVKSFDGVVRAAVLYVPGGKLLTRPLKLLYPIEVGIGEGDGSVPSTEQQTTQRRPVRAATAVARSKIQKILESEEQLS